MFFSIIIIIIIIFPCQPRGDCPVSMLADSGGPSHSDTIRDITFCPNGSLFASAGDDKLVKIWRTDTWSCVRTV